MTFGEVQSTVPNINWNINMKLIDIETQNRRILAHLQNGGTVTSLTALYDFGCLRLSGRIFELREAGYPVEDKWVETPSGKRVKMYFLRRSQSDSNLTSKRQHEPEAAAQMSIFDELRPITGE